MKITITKGKLQEILTDTLPNHRINTGPSRDLILQNFNEGVFNLRDIIEDRFDEVFKLVKFGVRRKYVNYVISCIYLNCCNKCNNQWISYPSDKLHKDDCITKFEYILGEDFLCTKTLYEDPKQKAYTIYDVYLRIKDSKVIYNLKDINVYVGNKYLADCPETRKYILEHDIYGG